MEILRTPSQASNFIGSYKKNSEVFQKVDRMSSESNSMSSDFSSNEEYIQDLTSSNILLEKETENISRSSPREVFLKKSVFKHFANFIGKHLY